MEPITARFVAENLEEAGLVLCNMEALLKSDADKQSLCDVLAWTLRSVQRTIFSAARVLREQSEPEPSAPTLDPEQMERNTQEAERVGQEVWEHFGRRRQ